MPIYNFKKQQDFISIDQIPDIRTEAQKQMSKVSVYNHGKSDLGYVERLGEEMLNVSGAYVTVFMRMMHAFRDAHADDVAGISPEEVLDEDAEPVYSNGLELKGFFNPVPRMLELTKWGIDISQFKIDVTFSRAVLLKHPSIGDRLLIPGDIIRVPYNHITEKNDPLYLRVNNATPDGNYHYRYLYHKCTCDIITGDEVVRVKHE